MTIVRFCLARVLAWVASLSWKDFLTIVLFAKDAAEAFPKTEQMTDAQKMEVNLKRAASVSERISEAHGIKSNLYINVIRELAVLWLNRSKS